MLLIVFILSGEKKFSITNFNYFAFIGNLIIGDFEVVFVADLLIVGDFLMGVGIRPFILWTGFVSTLKVTVVFFTGGLVIIFVIIIYNTTLKDSNIRIPLDTAVTAGIILNMGSIKDTNTRIAITVPKSKVWELKENAVKAKMSLSEYMVYKASTVVEQPSPRELIERNKSN